MRVRETGSAGRNSCCMSKGARFQQTGKLIVGMPAVGLLHPVSYSSVRKPASKQQWSSGKG